MKNILRTCLIGILCAFFAGIAVPACTCAWAAEKPVSLEARLQRLEDREAIRRLLMDYGRFLDKRDFASFAQLFSEREGEWIGGMGRAKGTQAIRKLMEDTIGKDTGGQISAPNYHLFANEIIQINGDQAQSNTKWIFVVQNNSKQPQLFYLGHYEDTIIREDGKWKFLKRVVYGDIPSDDPLSKK